MTESEINKAVAEKLGIAHKCDMGTVIMHGDSGCKSFDPCNNIEQAWEIMMEHNICVTQGDDILYDAFEGLYCEGETTFYYYNYKSHKNPLVAAMLCFLEMKE